MPIEFQRDFLAVGGFGFVGCLHEGVNFQCLAGGDRRSAALKKLYHRLDKRRVAIVTADRVFASLDARPHAYTVPRGADSSRTDGYPQDRLFIQRYVLPVNMLCNENSYSNAEIISHGFKALERGTLVGTQTTGSVISTGRATLIDGTTIRTPFRGWYLLDGTDMENNGAMPDLVVLQTPEDESAEHDAQLQKAVEDLLERLPDTAGNQRP